jgi:hypothetical protein
MVNSDSLAIPKRPSCEGADPARIGERAATRRHLTHCWDEREVRKASVGSLNSKMENDHEDDPLVGAAGIIDARRDRYCSERRSF